MMDSRSSLWERALCGNRRDDAFYTERSRRATTAAETEARRALVATASKKTCALCPIQSECLEYAIENKIKFGIWGGMTPRQRTEESKRRKRQDAELRRENEMPPPFWFKKGTAA